MPSCNLNKLTEIELKVKPLGACTQVATSLRAANFNPIPPSPFSLSGPAIWENSFTPIPLVPREKRPGQWFGEAQGWRGMSDWSQFQDESVQEWRLLQWCDWPEANIGVIHGEHFIGIDFDNDPIGCHPGIKEILARLDGTIVRRLGQKGYIQYFRCDGGVHTAVYRTEEGNALEVLGAGRQSVLPPSIHPDTKKAYQWITEDTLENTALGDLPLLCSETMGKIENLLKSLGWDDDKNRKTNSQNYLYSKGGGIDKELNNRAIADLNAWVPSLGALKTRTKVNGGFECVADWRPSSSGRDLSLRKRSLKIDPSGIKDFGDDQTYTPIDLVMAAKRLTFTEAWSWLYDRVGEKFEPWSPKPKTPTPEPDPEPTPPADKAPVPPVPESKPDADTGSVSLDRARELQEQTVETFRHEDIEAMRKHVKERAYYSRDCDLAALALKEAKYRYDEGSSELFHAEADYEHARVAERDFAQKPPPARILQVSAGVGKTRAVGKLFDGSINALVAQPTNDLALEFKDHIKAHGLAVDLMNVRGPDAIDPEKIVEGVVPDKQIKMCVADKSTDPMLKCGGNLPRMCGTEDNRCKFYDVCGMQRQARKLANATPNGRLYSTNHKRLTSDIDGIDQDRPLDALFIDESFVSSFMAGSNEDGVSGKRHLVSDIAKVGIGSTAQRAEAIDLLIVIQRAIEDQYRARKRYLEACAEDASDERTLSPKAGIDFLEVKEFGVAASAAYDDPTRKTLLKKFTDVASLFHGAADALLEKFRPNMSVKDSEKHAGDIRSRVLGYRQTAALLTEIRGVIANFNLATGRLVASEEKNEDGKMELRLKHMPSTCLSGKYAGDTAILIMNALPEPIRWMEKVLTYEIKVGGEIDGIKPRTIRVLRKVEPYPPITALIDDRLDIVLLDRSPTGDKSVQGWHDEERKYYKQQIKEIDKVLRAGKSWPKVSDFPDSKEGIKFGKNLLSEHKNKHLTATNNRRRIVRYAETLKETSTEGFLLGAKKSLSSWVKAHRGQDSTGIDYLSFGKASGINAYQNHDRMLLWGYDRVSALVSADIIGCITGEFVGDLSTFMDDTFVNLRDGGRQRVKGAHRYRNKRLDELDCYRRHSTVLQACERLRMRHEKTYRCEVHVAVLGDLPFAVDRVENWEKIQRDVDAADRWDVIEGHLEAGICSNFDLNEVINKGVFSTPSKLKNTIKSIRKRSGATVVKPLIYSSTILEVLPTLHHFSEFEFRAVGRPLRWSKFFYKEQTEAEAIASLRKRLLKHDVEIEVRNTGTTADQLPDNLPVSWRGIMNELELGEQDARRLAKRIAGGEFEDTHRAVTVRNLCDATPFGRPQQRLVRNSAE